VLQGLRDLKPDETKLYAFYQKQQPPKPQRALTDKLWERLLVHADAQGPVADLSRALATRTGQLLALSPKELGLDRKKLFVPIDLEAPVAPYFVNQVRDIRGILHIPPFGMFQKKGGTEPMHVALSLPPVWLVGEGNEVFREMPPKQLWFLIGRQLAFLRPAFLLPRALGPEHLLACMEAAMTLVDPRYPIQSNPALIQNFHNKLKAGGPAALAAIKAPATAILQTGQQINVTKFIYGVEHTTVRAAYLITGSLDLADTVLRRQDPSAAQMPYQARMRELMLFAISEEHFELRQRLGLAIQG
jgi:hypothetical protein